MPDILLAGHSHAYSLGLPSSAPGSQPKIVLISDGLYGMTGPWPRDESYWDHVVHGGVTRGYEVALSFLGSEHQAYFLLETDPFDFVLSSDPAYPLRSNVPLVPEALIRESFEGHREVLPKVMQKLKNAGLKTYILGSPPPKKDLKALLGTEQQFANVLNEAGLSLESATISPPNMRLKLWRLLQTMLEEVAVKYGALFVPYPAELMERDGFLLPKFWQNDISHANDAAGKIFRNQLIALAKEAV